LRLLGRKFNELLKEQVAFCFSDPRTCLTDDPHELLKKKTPSERAGFSRFWKRKD